jgi:integrase
VAQWELAHDLRRSFGQRWAARIMPQILMQLMRHETIETTMKYYVGREAEALWAAVGKVTKEVTRRRRTKNKLGN